MKIVPNKEMVLILPDPVSDKTEGGLHVPGVAKEKIMKAQNRGVVKEIGEGCDFVVEGDYVSFYRNAGTDILEDGTDYVLIHEDHILVKFETTLNVEK